ncbi:MAG TPA: hypothetical protein VK464_25140 [Symbiobacteriaceae bacterium]|jgi:hypothetical protein|nr:hypothetical protein [Symbiobacteriaceae bacterium]
MGSNVPRGHTGAKVDEAGTYRCEKGPTSTYVRGDVFRECPSTGKPTVWVKTFEPEHPGGSR